MAVDDQLSHTTRIQARQESVYGICMAPTREPLGISIERHAASLQASQHGIVILGIRKLDTQQRAPGIGTW